MFDSVLALAGELAIWCPGSLGSARIGFWTVGSRQKDASSGCCVFVDRWDSSSCWAFFWHYNRLLRDYRSEVNLGVDIHYTWGKFSFLLWITFFMAIDLRTIFQDGIYVLANNAYVILRSFLQVFIGFFPAWAIGLSTFQILNSME